MRSVADSRRRTATRSSRSATLSVGSLDPASGRLADLITENQRRRRAALALLSAILRNQPVGSAARSCPSFCHAVTAASCAASCLAIAQDLERDLVGPVHERLDEMLEAGLVRGYLAGRGTVGHCHQSEGCRRPTEMIRRMAAGRKGGRRPAGWRRRGQLRVVTSRLLGAGAGRRLPVSCSPAACT